MDASPLAALLLFALAFANGANDVSKAIATLVGSGVTNYRIAILWGSLWTMLGAAASGLLATAMVKTFSTGLIQSDAVIPPAAAPAVISAAMAWVLLASNVGLPVSTTHALTGAILGASLSALGSHAIIWSALAVKIAMPLLLSPVLALSCAVLLHPVLRAASARWEGTCVCMMPAERVLVAFDAPSSTRALAQTPALGQPVAGAPSACDQAGLRGVVIGLDTIHWLSSGLTAFARGTNDAPKLAAMLLLGGGGPQLNPLWLIGIALAMGLGSYVGGYRVTAVLAEKVTTMDHVEGLSANVTTSSLVLIAASLGLPVSTTHVSSSAIVGIGLLKGLRSVRWVTIRDMVLAWTVTLPASGLLAGATYLLLTALP